MNVKVLDIQLPAAAVDPAASFVASVHMDIDAKSEWFNFTVSPLGMPGSDTRIIEAELPFLDRFRGHQKVIHHVRRLVGQAVHVGGVHLPQLIAA
jgi:hypothetical protein